MDVHERRIFASQAGVCYWILCAESRIREQFSTQRVERSVDRVERTFGYSKKLHPPPSLPLKNEKVHDKIFQRVHSLSQFSPETWQPFSHARSPQTMTLENVETKPDLFLKPWIFIRLVYRIPRTFHRWRQMPESFSPVPGERDGVDLCFSLEFRWRKFRWNSRIVGSLLTEVDPAAEWLARTVSLLVENV